MRCASYTATLLHDRSVQRTCICSDPFLAFQPSRISEPATKTVFEVGRQASATTEYCTLRLGNAVPPAPTSISQDTRAALISSSGKTTWSTLPANLYDQFAGGGILGSAGDHTAS